MKQMFLGLCGFLSLLSVSAGAANSPEKSFLARKWEAVKNVVLTKRVAIVAATGTVAIAAAYVAHKKGYDAKALNLVNTNASRLTSAVHDAYNNTVATAQDIYTVGMKKARNFNFRKQPVVKPEPVVTQGLVARMKAFFFGNK